MLETDCCTASPHPPGNRIILVNLVSKCFIDLVVMFTLLLGSPFGDQPISLGGCYARGPSANKK